MDILDFLTLEPWWRFAVALGIGALVGLEREFIQQRRGEPDFAGIRTFSLSALLGAVAAFVAPEFGVAPLIVALAGLVIFGVASYVGDFVTTGKVGGSTTEVAVMLAYMLGAMAVTDWVEVAVALSVIVALLLSMKNVLHDLARRMSVQDLRSTLEFALVAAVVLPILPNQTIDPLNVINPSQIWLMVVFVSGIGFAGYILMKFLGTTRGLSLTALLGGVVSSTATTLSFSSHSKNNPALFRRFAQAIVIASCVMFPRVAIILLVINTSLLAQIAIPFAAMLIAGIGAVLLLQPKGEEPAEQPQDLEVDNPLKLSTALIFALIFAIVLVVVKVMQNSFGDAGVYVASTLTGLTGVDAITLSVARLASQGELAQTVAGSAIAIAAVMNTIAKAGIAMIAGSKEMRRPIAWAMGLIIAAGAISTGIMLWA